MSFEKRFLFSLFFFYLGLHVIALLIYDGGTNTRDNIVWQILSSLIAAEFLIIKAVLLIAAIGFVGLITTVLFEILTRQSKIDETSKEHHHLTQSVSTNPTPPSQVEAILLDDSQKIQPAELLPDPPDPPIEPAKPTVDEMKESAIEELLRGH